MAIECSGQQVLLTEEGRVLFACGDASSEICEVPLRLMENGYRVETVGIQEALWMWPLEGFDMLLVDATAHPEGALELCHHVKTTSAEQRVVLLFGDRTGAVPHHFQADAVLSGTPTRDQFLAVVRLLLAPQPAAKRAVPMKAPPARAAEKPGEARRAG